MAIPDQQDPPPTLDTAEYVGVYVDNFILAVAQTQPIKIITEAHSYMRLTACYVHTLTKMAYTSKNLSQLRNSNKGISHGPQLKQSWDGLST